MPSYDRALWALRTWLDCWSGIGHVAVGMHRQHYDFELTQCDERGWPRDVLHDRAGALADERDRHRVGPYTVVRDTASGVGGDRAGKRWLGSAPASRRRAKALEAARSRRAWRDPGCGPVHKRAGDLPPIREMGALWLALVRQFGN